MTYDKSKRDYVLCNRAGQTFNSDGQFCYDSSKMVIFSGSDRYSKQVRVGKGEFWEYPDVILTQRESE